MLVRLLVVLVLMLFTITATTATTTVVVVAGQKGTRITEDDPRWDCYTMGNLICGTSQDRQEKQGKQEKKAFYCGATTKKGTPCKRRVKQANVKCWQHKDKKVSILM